MIEEISIDPAEAMKVIPWWDKLPLWQTPTTIRFHRGLNLLVGPNGGGKSSLILLLARLFHAEQSGRSNVTHHSVMALNKANLPACKHDGGAVTYMSPDAEFGLAGHGSAFDEDFFEKGVAAVFARKASSGQRIIRKLNDAIVLIDKPARSEVFWSKVGKAEATKDFLSGNIPHGPPTVLLDEPERALDARAHAGFWSFLARKSVMEPRSQVIVATHSPVVFCRDFADLVIETQEGYAAACKKSWVSILGGGQGGSSKKTADKENP